MFPLQTKLAKESSEQKKEIWYRTKIREFKKRSSPVEILKNKIKIFLVFHGPFFTKKEKKQRKRKQKSLPNFRQTPQRQNTCRNIKKLLEEADNAMRLQLEKERKRNNKLSQKTIQVPQKQT